MKKTIHFVVCFLFANLAVFAQVKPDEAIQKLKDGNERFVSGKRSFENLSAARMKEVVDKGQSPFVTLLSCADSRVPVEHIFDAGIGDLFVIRVAGNVSDVDEIGTAEYGVGHLHTPLMVVLGHSDCGAVKAVCQNADVHGSIPKLVDNIIAPVKAAKAKYGDKMTTEMVNAAIENNVYQSMDDAISHSEEIAELIETGKLKLVGAIYDLNTGSVTWLGESPKQKECIKKAKENTKKH